LNLAEATALRTTGVTDHRIQGSLE
jgi:hypothetical protein